MIDATVETTCVGVEPLTARWEPWMRDLLRDAPRCAALVETHGSPLHVHDPAPFHRNIGALASTARDHGVELGVFFARKANKCLVYVDEAARAGIGVDLAGPAELEQSLERGLDADRLVMTAAIKTPELLQRCVEEGVLVVVDNEDEATRIAEICRTSSRPARVAVRVSAFHGIPDSRFGIPLAEVAPFVRAWRSLGLRFEGLHFHLDGYAASDRVNALDRCIQVADDLRELGAPVGFIDMGGGFPMSYLVDEGEWRSYWAALEQSLLGRRDPITYRNHGFGLIEHDGVLVGRREAYPHHQSPVGGHWLATVLTAARPSRPDETIADALRQRELRLHCEPGRALLDGCGMTLARVEHCKRVGDDWHIGLHMNSSNCRSRKSELFADPLLVRTGSAVHREPMAGYLTGAYCAESEFVMHRRLRFPTGVAPGDLLAFPNTAGYLMHFVESRSHQFELPRNVIVGPHGDRPDPIDREQNQAGLSPRSCR